jgi:hypothetical protein
VTPARLERATCGLGNHRSIQLSYGACLGNYTYDDLLPRGQLEYGRGY